MLSKAICKRCWNERNPRSPWDKGDEDWWLHGGKVSCILPINSIYWTDVLGEPPKDCPYFLEQTLYSMSFEKTSFEKQR